MGAEERRRGYIPRGRIKITSPSGRVQQAEAVDPVIPFLETR